MMTERTGPAPRASERDRDQVLVRLHTAYAEGLLDDRELDERIDLVLAAGTTAELGRLAAELPAREEPAVRPEAAAPEPSGRFQMAYKSRLRRGGRWRLPERYTAVLYKGGCELDLREAELSARVTTVRVVSYKSPVRIIVPPGVRVEAGGMGVSTEVRGAPSPSAPVVHVQGIAYKGPIEVIDHLRLS
ncbi:DUF1707 domain-containing protein [Actinomadura sp. 21ATH]|uniref:DUF1707 SHOCT-like domain-containing protein n=1 Tax=Actinomadura sp. 21ATH TaxID=1735444 RepID=UPI0035C119B3